MWLTIKIVLVAALIVGVARFTLFSDAAEFALFAAVLKRYGLPIIGVWLVATMAVSLVIITNIEIENQGRPIALLTYANSALAVVIIGGLFTAFKLGFLT